jgi:hypothetical protein
LALVRCVHRTASDGTLGDRQGGWLLEGVRVRLPAWERTPHVSTWEVLAAVVGVESTGQLS